MNQTEQIFNDVYTILVDECGAPKADHYRQSFIQYHTEEKPEWIRSTTEWRFGGKFGMGGKFWVRKGFDAGFKINCYEEELTEELIELIISVNEKLVPLFELYKEVENG